MKLFCGALFTETNTFSRLPTTHASFAAIGIVRGREAALAHPVFGGWLAPVDAGCRAAGMDLVCGTFAGAQPGGIIVQADYEALRDQLLADLREARPDAVLLLLHGAMVAEQTWDCEGDLLGRVRRLVGPQVPVAAVLDPHAHLTADMVAAADVLAFMKEYPHTDGPERMRDMFALLRARLGGAPRPRPAVIDCEAIGAWPTTAEPIRGLVDRFYAAERRPGIVSASFVHGFPWGDTPATGARVLVYAAEDLALAQATAAELAAAVVALREASQLQTASIDEALDAVSPDGGLTVLADIADNAGGGAPADSTFILERALARGMRGIAFGLFHAPELVARAFEVGTGGQLAGHLGGSEPEISGRPLEFRGTVRGLARDAEQVMMATNRDRLGDAAWLEIAGLDVVLCSLRTQCFDPSAFEAVGLDVRRRAAAVVKSTTHFRAGFAPLARRILLVDTPGALRTDFARIPYRHLREWRWPQPR